MCLYDLQSQIYNAVLAGSDRSERRGKPEVTLASKKYRKYFAGYGKKSIFAPLKTEDQKLEKWQSGRLRQS